MPAKFGLSFVALSAAMIFTYSPAMAQSRYGGNRGSGNYNAPAPSSPFAGNQEQQQYGYPQQQYPQQQYQNPQNYSNGYQNPGGYGGYSNGSRGYSNSYTDGGYYNARPGYGYYEPRYDRGRREHKWRERMRHERDRYRWGW